MTQRVLERVRDRGGIGYLLKDRIGRVSEFTDALHRAATGGTAMDPEVMALVAEGMDNQAIATRLFITDNAVHKHIGGIFAKLGLVASDSGHRRVRAVLMYLNGRG